MAKHCRHRMWQRTVEQGQVRVTDSSGGKAYPYLSLTRTGQIYILEV
jgi:hypothetical protein